MGETTTRKLLDQRSAELAIISSVQQALTARLSLQEIYDAVGDKIREIFRNVDVSIRIYDPAANLIHCPYYCERGQRIALKPYHLGERGVTAHVMRTRETLVWNENVVQEVEKYGSYLLPGTQYEKSSLWVPLVVGDQARGLIQLQNMEREQAFSDSDVRLLQTLANGMSVALENVRLFNETKEALERQTATSEILRVISQSPTDVQPVFDSIAERAATLCGARFGFVTSFDGEWIHMRATYGPGAEEHRSGYPIRPGPGAVAARVIRDRATVLIEDMLADREYAHKEAATRQGFRSLFGVPMMRDGQVLGCIAVARPEAGPFPEKQVALLQTFADQAAIAIENVRLFDEVQARTRELSESLQQQTATAEVLKLISRSAFDLQTVLDTLAESACELCDATLASIWRPDGDGFKVAALFGHSPALRDALRQRVVKPGRDTCTGRALLEGRTVHIRDTMADPEYDAPDVVELAGNLAIVAVPLLREGAPIGALVLTRTVAQPFTENQIALATTFADQAVIAIENVRLFREIEVKSRELEAASRHKSEFLANMSHELRTPLNAIIGFSEVLYERMFGEINEKQAEYIGDILQSGQHLLSLINDILDLSKIEAGRMELELSDVDLPSIIENTLILVRERAVRRSIALGRTVDEHLGTIRADERKVKQVLLNLLSNALKFTPEGGKINVRAAVSDGVAEISVTDTGVGIAPEEQEAVFEEFRQVGTASKKAEGTGLGLAISRKFIELHGGRIWVKSTVGSGSTFAFTLPLCSS